MARLRIDDRGLTVIELVIASALLMIIVGAAFSMLDSGTRTERLQQARHSALLDLRESVTRLTKDTRQALSIKPESTRDRLLMTTLIAGEEQEIGYAVVNGQFVRLLGGGQTEVLLADHVTSEEPFCYDRPLPPPDEECLENNPPGNITILRITLALEPEVFSGGPITLATEIQLRNL